MDRPMAPYQISFAMSAVKLKSQTLLTALHSQIAFLHSGLGYLQVRWLPYPYTVKCRYNAVFGVQEIDRVIAVTAL